MVALSQYVELSYADELLGADGGRVGYLLKDRVVDVEEFVSTLRQVVAGGTVIDPWSSSNCSGAGGIRWHSYRRESVRCSP